ncbi:MAG TPA: ABC transporter ATP-binding protein [Spirochaetia bacterium]
MIRTTGLVKRYGAFTAVDGIDLSIPRGQVYGFLGPNGAGKTSTIMMLLGITRPTAGEIRLFGERYTPDRLDLRRRIGVVPEKHPRGVWPWMTARDYLRLFADLFEVPDAGKRIETLLAKVDLERSGNKRIREFSHGMLQKLSFIRALLPDPDILFLDEPISGLDPLGIKQVRDLIVSENREGRTIFISSHQLSEMEKICHRVAIIFRGKLMVEDTMENLLARVAPELELRVELAQTPEGAVAGLGALPFVRGVSGEGATLVVRLSRDADHRRALSEHLIRAGLVPVRIEEKSTSLEEAFITITQENVDRLARGGKA